MEEMERSMDMEVLDEAPVTAPGPVTGGLPVAFQNINQGTVAIEASRAIAEAQSKLFIAKQFPRDESEAMNKMKRACSRMSLAAKAFYSFPRGGQTITGPTIRSWPAAGATSTTASKSCPRTMGRVSFRRMRGIWKRTPKASRISPIRTSARRTTRRPSRWSWRI